MAFTLKGAVAYQSDRVTLYRGDASDVIAGLPRWSVDLIVTDPPYGVRYQSNFRDVSLSPLHGDDGSLDVPAMLGAVTHGALRTGRHVYVFGYGAERLIEPMRLSSTCELIWDKGNMSLGDLSLPWAATHERITFGVHYPSKANRDARKGALSARLRHGTVLTVPRKNSRAVSRHPTEKPVQLMRQLIESSSNGNDVVFDPFAGCGSTLVAALLSGRRAIGVEIDEQFVATSVARITSAERVADQIEAA